MRIIGVLEKVEKSFILDDKYAGIRKKVLAKRSGVYALYDKKGNLYYVGKASDLKGRLNQHSKHNKHSGKWERVSIYFTKNENTAVEVEAIALSLLWGWGKPKGNTQKPKVKKDKEMKAWIIKEMGKITNKMMYVNSRSSLRTRNSKNSKDFGKAASQGGNLERLSLKELFSQGFLRGPHPLKKEYKKSGKIFHAALLPSGKIQCQGALYPTPSAAAKAITGKGLNGWTFWSIQNKSSQWVTLDEFVKTAASGSKEKTAAAGQKALGQGAPVFSLKPHPAKDARDAWTEWKKEKAGEACFFSGETLTLQAEYKGKTYPAKLLSCGKRVQYGGKVYDSPSAAAKAITGSSVNGWAFWSAQASPGKWVTLKSLKKSFAGKAS